MVDLLVLQRPAKKLQNGAGFSRETCAYWACRKGKSGLSATERAVGKYAGAPFAKKKKQSCLSRAPDRKWEGVKVSKLERGDQSRSIKRKEWTP